MAEPTPAQRAIGENFPKFLQLTEELVLGDIWQRPGLSPRDRSLITLATLIANGSTEQLPGHLRFGRSNGLTDDELKEMITHLAFYVGFPRTTSAITVANQMFAEDAA